MYDWEMLNKITSGYKLSIGKRMINDNLDITITDRNVKIDSKGRRWKYYKFICNKCGYNCGGHYKNGQFKEEHWILEGNLLNQNNGCPCCIKSPQIVVEGINDIPTTAPWMIKYFQGGYDEAKKYNRSSSIKIYPICPECNKIKEKKVPIYSMFEEKGISCICNEKISFPERVMRELLERIDVNFIKEYSPMWSTGKRYDFYIPKLECIIETHGMQHYEENKIWARTLKEEQRNDKYKEELALANGIKHYIQLDCRYSNIEYIKNNILKSELINIFNLSEIDSYI